MFCLEMLSQHSNAAVCSPAKATLAVSTHAIAYQFITFLKLFVSKKSKNWRSIAAEFTVAVEEARLVWITTNEVGDRVKSGDLLLLLMTTETEGGRRTCLQSLRS